MMKEIPNLFTLLNLVFGCMAIVAIVQPSTIVVQDGNGESFINLPEEIYLGSLFIGLAAVTDFLDGFVARLMKATSELGKQLDSLADVVSFGVAPSLIIYQFLKLGFAGSDFGVNVPLVYLSPAFVFAAAGAYRLGKFNLSNGPGHYFSGLPIPAAGLVVAGFPLIYWSGTGTWMQALFANLWFWYLLIFFLSYLMLSSIPMLALKFTKVTVTAFIPFVILLITGVVSAVLVGWLAVPIVFIGYIVLSFIFKPSK